MEGCDSTYTANLLSLYLNLSMWGVELVEIVLSKWFSNDNWKKKIVWKNFAKNFRFSVGKMEMMSPWLPVGKDCVSFTLVQWNWQKLSKRFASVAPSIPDNSGAREAESRALSLPASNTPASGPEMQKVRTLCLHLRFRKQGGWLPWLPASRPGIGGEGECPSFLLLWKLSWETSHSSRQTVRKPKKLFWFSQNWIFLEILLWWLGLQIYPSWEFNCDK